MKLKGTDDNNFKQWLNNKKIYVYISLFILWICIWIWSASYNLGKLYFIISIFLLILFSLGKKDKDSPSAYSIFNKGGKRLLGDGINFGILGKNYSDTGFEPDNTYSIKDTRENRFTRNKSLSQKPVEEYFALRKNIIETKNFSTYAQEPCYCGSSKKYKICCMDNDIRVSKLQQS